MLVLLHLKPIGEHAFNLVAKLGFQILPPKERVWVCRANHSMRIAASLHDRERRTLQCLQCFNNFYPHIRGAWPIGVNSLQTHSLTYLPLLSCGRVKRGPGERPGVLLRGSNTSSGNTETGTGGRPLCGRTWRNPELWSPGSWWDSPGEILGWPNSSFGFFKNPRMKFLANPIQMCRFLW